MGKLSNDPVIQHYSHQHPLELLQLSTTTTTQLTSPPCSACKLKASSWVYACKPCNYILHISCSQMPQLINHPADSHHPLCLLPLPAYPEGYFNCDACGRRGDGFSYHCGTCDLDVHILCASMPLAIDHQAHHHPLTLTFFPPYENKGFSCDICKNLGSNNWLYRCSACEFDAHLDCATKKPRPTMQVQQPQMLPQAANIQFQGGEGRFGSGPLQQGYVRNYYMSSQNQGAPQAVQPARQSGGLTNQAMQGFADSAIQQEAQNLVQAIMGGGGGCGSGGGGGDGGNGGDSSSVSIFDVGSSVLNSVFTGGSVSSDDN